MEPAKKTQKHELGKTPNPNVLCIIWEKVNTTEFILPTEEASNDQTKQTLQDKH